MKRWTQDLKTLKALSVRQPWAWLIVNGHKDIENRSRRTHYRGRILIHAGLNKTDFNEEVLKEISRDRAIEIPQTLDIGGIVGVVEITDCVRRSKSSWHYSGEFGWVLRNAHPLPYRACKGALGFFTPSFDDVS